MSFDPAKKYKEPTRVIPEGGYLMQVVDCQTRKSASGNPMLDMTIAVIDASSPAYRKEVRSFYMLTESDTARWFLSLLCRALDPRMRTPGSGFDPFSQESVDDFIVGKLFVGSVYHEDDEYNGKSFKVARVSKRDIRSLNTNEETLLKEQNGGKLPMIASTVDEDEVPF